MKEVRVDQASRSREPQVPEHLQGHVPLGDQRPGGAYLRQGSVTGGLFSLNDALARQLAVGNLLWFRVDVAKTKDIAEHRSELARWLGALMNTTPLTGVDWTA